VESVATATGILISDSSYNIRIINPYFEAINKGIQIDAGTQNVKVDGFYCYNWGTNNVLDNSGATGGDISVKGMATLASGAGTSVPFNYHSAVPQIVFNSSGTLTAQQVFGAVALRVRVLGGGGAGGGAQATTAQASVGGGGQAGAYAEGTIPLTSITFPVTVTVGAAGAANSGAAGGNGGTSSFGTLISVSGGTGGTTMAANTTVAVTNGGFGGATISGAFAQVQATGNEGQSAYRFSATQATSGYGAGSIFGGGIIPTGAVTTASGRSSGVVGSGGSGGLNIGTQSAVPGGAGVAGVVIVEPIY
jgi:hypothetical protein